MGLCGFLVLGVGTKAGWTNSTQTYTRWRIRGGGGGGVRGVQMRPPFEGLPSRVLSNSAQT